MIEKLKQDLVGIIAITFLLFILNLWLLPSLVEFVKGNFFPPKYAKTTGKIIRSEVDISRSRRGTRYRPYVEYQYRVRANNYNSTKIRFAMRRWRWNRRTTLAFLRKYPYGLQVTVYYDPQNPHFAVLQPTKKAPWYEVLYLFSFPALFLFFASGTLYLGKSIARDKRDKATPSS